MTENIGAYVLEADRDVNGREEARDPTAHRSGAEERGDFNRTRSRIGAGIFLGRFVQEEEVNEALGDVPGKKLLHALGFELERALARSPAFAQHVDDRERRRIVSFCLGQNPLFRLGEQDSSADGVRGEQPRRERSLTPFRFLAVLEISKELERAPPKLSVGYGAIDNPETLGTLGVDTSAAQDEIERLFEPDEPAEAAWSLPTRGGSRG